MTGEELMVELCEAFNRRDLPGSLPFLTEDVELQDYPGMVDGGWNYGEAGVADWAAKLLAVFGDMQLEPSDFRQVGDRFFYAWRAELGQARFTGIGGTREGWGVGTLRGGKLARLELYDRREDALAAVGLPVTD